MRYRNWWSLQITKRATNNQTLFFAVHPHPIELKARPNAVDHAFSAGLEEGCRHYAFYTKETLDKFLADNPKAEQCQNPIGGGK